MTLIAASKGHALVHLEPWTLNPEPYAIPKLFKQRPKDIKDNLLAR